MAYKQIHFEALEAFLLLDRKITDYKKIIDQQKITDDKPQGGKYVRRASLSPLLGKVLGCQKVHMVSSVK